MGWQARRVSQTAAPLTFPVVPMRAVAGEMPRPDQAEQWAYEIKWDGMRIVAFVLGDGSVRLQSARPREVTLSFPELAGLGAATGGRPAILDGELVALDDAGRPSFGRLQQRMHVVAPAEVRTRAAAVPVALQLFDLLALADHQAVSLPYLERRRLLRELIAPGPSWRVPAHYLEDGPGLLVQMAELGLEGLVAKRRQSIYEVGRRSPNWRKIKVRRRQEFVVGGWSPGEGRRRGQLASLLVGAYETPGHLRFVGRVGTGFTEAELVRLGGLLAPLERPDPPFAVLDDGERRRPARWVQPCLVVEVAFAEWTQDRLLRHPAYQGQRLDKDPATVTFAP